MDRYERTKKKQIDIDIYEWTDIDRKLDRYIRIDSGRQVDTNGQTQTDRYEQTGRQIGMNVDRYELTEEDRYIDTN